MARKKVAVKAIEDLLDATAVPREQARRRLKKHLSSGSPDLRELVGRIPKGYRVGDLDWLGPVGSEVW